MKKILAFFTLFFTICFILGAVTFENHNTQTNFNHTVDIASTSYPVLDWQNGLTWSSKASTDTSSYTNAQMLGTIKDLPKSTFTISLTNDNALKNGTSSRPIEVYLVESRTDNQHISHILSSNNIQIDNSNGNINHFDVVFALPGSIQNNSYNGNQLLSGSYTSTTQITVDNETGSFELYGTYTSTTPQSVTPPLVSVTPMHGYYGIDLGSRNYPIYDTKRSLTWQNGSFQESPATGDQHYYDSQIIGIASTTANVGSRITLSAAISGNDFVFTSQANNNYTRPFKLYGVIQEGNAYNDRRYVAVAELTGNTSTTFTSTKRKFWLDLILCIPYSDSISDLKLTDPSGRIYYLSDANDYGAVVSIEMKVEDGVNSAVEKTQTFPLMGYYHRDEDTLDEPVASIIFTPAAEIQNIDLSYSSAPIYIGDLDFMIDRGKAGEHYTVVNDKYVNSGNGAISISGSGDINAGLDRSTIIFLSASSDPFTQNSNGFRFVSDSVSDDSLIDRTNNVSYYVRVENNNNVSDHKAYGGTAYFDKNGTQTVKTGVINPLIGEESTLVVEKKAKQNYNVNGNYYVYWSEFHGKVYIQLNNVNENNMVSGRYTSNIYIHCLAK